MTNNKEEKPRRLCESIKKTCTRKALDAYLYCTKHILEDPKAPFHQCEYVSARSNKRCTNPIPNKLNPDGTQVLPHHHREINWGNLNQEMKYCVSHRHLLDTSKKRPIESTNPAADLTPSKKLQKVLEKQGILKGKSYDLYKRMIDVNSSNNNNNNNVNFNQPKQNTTTTTTTTTTTITPNNINQELGVEGSNENNVINETNYFNSEYCEDELKDLYKPFENLDNLDIYESFDSDFYFSQSLLLTEEEVVQRKKVYLSKLILLYRKQYDRYIERLRILRRHYIHTALNNQNNQNNENDNENDDNSLQIDEIESEQPMNVDKVDSTISICKDDDDDDKCNFLNCKMKSILFSGYCFAHILEDPDQKMFIGCNYLMTQERKCNYPILKFQIPSLCKEHLDIYNSHLEIIKSLPKAQRMLLKQQLLRLQPNITVLPSLPVDNQQ